MKAKESVPDTHLVRAAAWCSNYGLQCLTLLSTIGIAVCGVIISLPPGMRQLKVLESGPGVIFAFFTLVAITGNIKQVMEAPGLKSLQAENDDLRKRISEHEDLAEQRGEDHREIFQQILSDFSNKILCFGTSERISVYTHDGNSFVMVGRYSQSAVFTKFGRATYPEGEGCIGAAWRDGQAIASDLPDPKGEYAAYCQMQVTRWVMPRATVRGLTMKSRSYAAYTIYDFGSTRPLGVIVFESTRTNALNPELLRKVISDHEGVLVRHLALLPTLPKPSLAMREGY